MKKLLFTLFVVLMVGCAFFACATPPTEEMSRAQDAVFRAENDPDAVVYAPSSIIRAREALVQMQIEADARRYDSARGFATEATSHAERAIAEGRAGALRAREEAANLLGGLQTPMAETSSALGAARAGDLPLDFNALTGEMDIARRMYNGAEQSLAAEEFQDAITMGQEVRGILSDINAQISDAAQVLARKQ